MTSATELVSTVLHDDRHGMSGWWRDAVIYQVYPRSWADSDGDGVGDLPGITSHLPYLRDLGVDAVWLSPFYVSPMNDAGYDVADHRDVDPLFGSLADADALVGRAHALGLRVIVDLVPNHSSNEHPWFVTALASAPGSPERDRYIFRDGTGPHGDLPPNDWKSVFGGVAWTRVTEVDGSAGQWYLHLFDTTQPDFNWRHAEVRGHFTDILRFWLDRGVDGFRIDVAHGLIKADGLPSWPHPTHLVDPDETGGAHPPMWDQDGVHEIYRDWRRLIDRASGPERILCAEAWVSPPERLARYLRPNEMHQAFNFDFLRAGWDRGRLDAAIATSYGANDAVGAPTTWVLSNHDVVRHASRFGLTDPTSLPNGIGPGDEQPDRELGLRRGRAATTLMLALPGSAYIYQGEELGLPEATELAPEVRQDPTHGRSGGIDVGRDGCRIPMPWTASGPSLGFGPAARTWLPQPDDLAGFAVDQQRGRSGSTLELYRTLLNLRRQRGLGRGSLTRVGDPGDDAMTLVNTGRDGRSTWILCNFGDEPVPLPREWGEVLVASGDLTGAGEVPPDTAVWVG